MAMLTLHPSFIPPVRKEAHLFDDPAFEEDGGGTLPSWYLRLFPANPDPSRFITAEATPSYLASDVAPRAMARAFGRRRRRHSRSPKHAPHANPQGRGANSDYHLEYQPRFVVLLRDPAQRAYSEIQMQSRRIAGDHAFASAVEAYHRELALCLIAGNSHHLDDGADIRLAALAGGRRRLSCKAFRECLPAPWQEHDLVPQTFYDHVVNEEEEEEEEEGEKKGNGHESHKDEVGRDESWDELADFCDSRPHPVRPDVLRCLQRQSPDAVSGTDSPCVVPPRPVGAGPAGFDDPQKVLLAEMQELDACLEQHGGGGAAEDGGLAAATATCLPSGVGDNLGGLPRFVFRGLYRHHLMRWLEHFPPEQFLILESSLLRYDPGRAMAHVVEFAGLRSPLGDGDSDGDNGGNSNSIRVKNVLRQWADLSPNATAALVARHFPEMARAGWVGEGVYGPPSAQLLDRLADFYARHNAGLEAVAAKTYSGGAVAALNRERRKGKKGKRRR